MAKVNRAQPKCDICGRAKNSFADLRIMMKRVNGVPHTKHVCAATFSCRDKAEQDGYRG